MRSVQPGNQKQTSPTPPPPAFPKEEHGSRDMVLLSQDPTVCQTLNRTNHTPTVPQPHTPKGTESVLGRNTSPAAAIC